MNYEVFASYARRGTVLPDPILVHSCRIREAIAGHEGANGAYLDSSVRLLEPAQRAGQLFRTQPAPEKRKLLDFVLSNCSCAKGELKVTYRQPFDLFADSAVATKETRPAGAVTGEPHPTWLGNRDSNPARRCFQLRDDALLFVFCS